MLKILSDQSIMSNVAHAKLSTDAPSGEANYLLSLHISGERMRDALTHKVPVSRSTVNKQRILAPDFE